VICFDIYVEINIRLSLPSLTPFSLWCRSVGGAMTCSIWRITSPWLSCSWCSGTPPPHGTHTSYTSIRNVKFIICEYIIYIRGSIPTFPLTSSCFVLCVSLHDRYFALPGLLFLGLDRLIRSTYASREVNYSNIQIFKHKRPSIQVPKHYVCAFKTLNHSIIQTFKRSNIQTFI
jgi:hypothetical protein